jgi:hypothetical protein
VVYLRDLEIGDKLALQDAPPCWVDGFIVTDILAMEGVIHTHDTGGREISFVANKCSDGWYVFPCFDLKITEKQMMRKFPKKMRKALKLVEEIEELQAQLKSLLSGE